MAANRIQRLPSALLQQESWVEGPRAVSGRGLDGILTRPRCAARGEGQWQEYLVPIPALLPSCVASDNLPYVSEPQLSCL